MKFSCALVSFQRVNADLSGACSISTYAYFHTYRVIKIYFAFSYAGFPHERPSHPRSSTSAKEFSALRNLDEDKLESVKGENSRPSIEQNTTEEFIVLEENSIKTFLVGRSVVNFRYPLDSYYI